MNCDRPGCHHPKSDHARGNCSRCTCFSYREPESEPSFNFSILDSPSVTPSLDAIDISPSHTATDSFSGGGGDGGGGGSSDSW